MKRPGLEEFIEKVADWYEVIVFTASMSKYANPLLDKIDPKRCIAHRLFREHCSFVGNAFVKDLSLIGRELKNIIILDNSSVSYAFQPQNAIPVITWLDNKSDTQLYDLMPILELLSRANDVRDYLKKIVKNDTINCGYALKTLKNELVHTSPGTQEQRKTLINSWVPQQGKIISQVSEKTQQSQLITKEYLNSRYLRGNETSTNSATRINTASGYTRQHDSIDLLKNCETTKHENETNNHNDSRFLHTETDSYERESKFIPTNLLSAKNLRQSYDSTHDKKPLYSPVDTAKEHKTSATPIVTSAVRDHPKTFLTSTPMTTKSQYLYTGSKESTYQYKNTPTKPIIAASSYSSKPTESTPVTARSVNRNISEEKTVNPNPSNRVNSYYSNLISSKERNENIETEPDLRKINEESKSRINTGVGSSALNSNNAKMYRSSYSVERNNNSLRASTPKVSNETARRASPPKTYASPINTTSSVNLLNQRANSHLNSTQTDFMPKTNNYMSSASKTASSGFYNYTPEKKSSSKTLYNETSVSTPFKEKNSLQYLSYYHQQLQQQQKEREGLAVSSRPYLISRSGGVYPTYNSSSSKAAWIGRQYNA